MRVLANENIPRRVVEAMRQSGHDVSWAVECCASARDEEVLALATAQSRILVTQDRDFGELVIRQGLHAPCGVVLLRLPPIPELMAQHVSRVLDGTFDASGKFVVVEVDRVRQRELPRSGAG